MKTLGQTTAEQVKAYCTKIGADPLLTQGAGGNVSWKDGEFLWVKASGTWLAHAENEEIFIAVDLAHLRVEIADKNFSATPKVVGDSSLRPSIETMLHALMPHKIVVHLHAVDILAHLVRANPLADLHQLIPDDVDWVFVDYFKPGEELAKSVSTHVADHPGANVIFLRNHGVVVGAESISEIEHIVNSLTQTFSLDTGEHFHKQVRTPTPKKMNGYICFQHGDLNQLATNKEYFDYLKTKWALYPDHIVFLGASPHVYESFDEFAHIREKLTELPELVFIYKEGVYVLPQFSKAKTEQLCCYYNVLIRQKSMSQLKSLSDTQVSELIDWEAEKYRKNNSN
jgi:rhamnose utilization protein RhaD (predicted bifunctional aldolase and dehydrogenase)